MKYAPKKVFVLENGKYQEITYIERQKREQEDKTYTDKKYLPMHGMLIEVTKATYKAYYKEKRRQKYIDECSLARGDISYNALDTDETLGEEIIADKHIDVEQQVIDKIMSEQVRKAISMLPSGEKNLISQYFYQGMSQKELSKIYGVNQSNISRKIERIVVKLKKFLEN